MASTTSPGVPVYDSRQGASFLDGFGEEDSVTAAKGFLAWSETFVTPTLFVHGDARLVWSNRAAREMLASGRHLRVNHGRLTCADPTLDPDLRKFLAEVGPKPSVWLCRGDSEHVLLRGESVLGLASEALIGLVVTPTNVPVGGHLWADFGGVFGLTPSEVQVVKLLTEGQRADEVAASLGVTLETIRTHIRRTYAKMGVGSREQMFAIVSQFRTL